MKTFYDSIKYKNDTVKSLREGLQKKLKEDMLNLAVANFMVEENHSSCHIEVYASETITTAIDDITYGVQVSIESAEPKCYLYHSQTERKPGKLWNMYKKSCERKGEKI